MAGTERMGTEHLGTASGSAELIADVGAELGEGATLFPDGSVWWVDLLAGRTYRWRDGAHEEGPVFPHEVAKVLPGVDQPVLIGREYVEYADLEREPVTESEHIARIGDAASHVRGSDSTVLPDGSIVFGVVDLDLTPGRGALRWSRGGHVRVIVDKATIPNGIAVMPDSRSVVWTDSPTNRLDLFDIDEVAGLVNRRPFAHIPSELGVPDGVCVDMEGGVWVAMWGGGCVIRVTKEGHIDAQIHIGVPHVTSCAFDADDALIVTTASVALSQQERRDFPHAGGLFRVDPSVHRVRGARTFVASNP